MSHQDPQHITVHSHVTVKKDIWDRIASWASVAAAIGALAAAIMALLAYSEAKRQTAVTAAGATASQQAAEAEQKTAALDSQAALVVQCPFIDISKSYNVDGYWEFNGNDSGFVDMRRTVDKPIGLCTITNFGRVPALLVTIRWLYIREHHAVCDSILIAQKYGATEVRNRLFHYKDISIGGISAGGTYTFAMVLNTDDYISPQLPDKVWYETPIDKAPSRQRLFSRANGGMSYPTRSRQRQLETNECAKRLMHPGQVIY